MLNRQQWLEVDIQGWLTAMEFLNAIGIRCATRVGNPEQVRIEMPPPYGQVSVTKSELINIARVAQTALEMEQRR